MVSLRSELAKPKADAFAALPLATASRCGRAACESRRMVTQSKCVVVRCSAKCRVKYHFPSCWKPVLRSYRLESGDLAYDGPCVTPDCYGTLVAVDLKHGKKTLSEIVSQPVVRPSRDSAAAVAARGDNSTGLRRQSAAHLVCCLFMQTCSP